MTTGSPPKRPCAEDFGIKKMPNMSPSALETFTMCQTKWYYDKAAGYPRASSPAAELGSAVHDVLETYLKTGQKPDTTTKEGRIAASGLHHLPDPMSVNVETWVPRQSCGPLRFVGKVDFWKVDDGVYSIFDHKTSSNPEKYGKTADDLTRHPQMLAYAYAMFKGDSPEWVNVEHIYYRTRGGLMSYPVRAKVPWSTIASNWTFMETVAQQMVDVLASHRPTRTLSACGAFGGCPFSSLCEGSNNMEEKIDNLVMKIESFFRRGKSISFATFEARCMKEGLVPGAVLKAGKMTVVRGYVQRCKALEDLEEILDLFGDAERMMGEMTKGIAERVLKTHGKSVDLTQAYLDEYDVKKLESSPKECPSAPVEEAPVEEAPVEEAPVEEAPVLFQQPLPEEDPTAPHTHTPAPVKEKAASISTRVDSAFEVRLYEMVGARVAEGRPAVPSFVKDCIREVYGVKRVAKKSGRKLLLSASRGEWDVDVDLTVYAKGALEEAPVEQATAKEAPVEQATAKEAAAKEATAKEAAAKEAAAKEAAAKEATAKEATAKEAAAKEATAKEATAKEAPAPMALRPAADAPPCVFIFVDCYPQAPSLPLEHFGTFIAPMEASARIGGHKDEYIYTAAYAMGPKAVASQLAVHLAKQGLVTHLAMRSDHPAASACLPLLAQLPNVVVVR